MNQCKIFVSLHKKSYVPKLSFLNPIALGSYKGSNNMLDDSAKENISNLNPYFSELTAQYWAWKNVDIDYYGFFHYRRYLSFVESLNEFNNIERDVISNDVLEEFGIDENHLNDLLSKYDVILPLHENLKSNFGFANSLLNQYKNSPGHNLEDLENAIKIVHELYPSFDKYVHEAIKGRRTYFFNIFIMKKQYFKEYCEWLFPILFKLHESKKYDNLSVYEKRMVGFVSERLFTIFVFYLRDKYPNIRIKECQTILFSNSINPYINPAYDNKSCLCFACDNNYAKHLSITLTSLVCNTSIDKKYDIIIFDNNLSLQNKNALQSIVDGNDNVSIRFLPMSSYITNKKIRTKMHISSSTYLRFLAFDFLRNYEKFIYLDCDLLINTDVSKLYDVVFENNIIAAVRDTVMGSWCSNKGFFGDKQRRYVHDVLKIQDIYDYFNAGVAVFNVKEILKTNLNSKELFKIATSRKWDWLDQDVLNFVFNGKVKYLNNSWNVMVNDVLPLNEMRENVLPSEMFLEYLEAMRNPFIIHYAGHQQPIYNKNAEFSDLYWKYARMSPFYEQVIMNMNAKESINVRFKSKMKRLLPYNSKRGRMARNIYHLLKR